MVNWASVLQGAGGGALGGSSFSPMGTLIGGGLGALGGLFGGPNDGVIDKQNALYGELAGGPQKAEYSDFRNNQRNYIGQLEAMAAGRGPSLATQQLKSATDRNIKQQTGLAQSGIGNPAAAMMAAQNNAGMLGAQSAQDSAAARIQEQLNAMNLLGVNLYGARGADEDMNRFNSRQQMENYQLRANMLNGMGSQGGPSMGEQILAGGAGMYGQSMQMKMLQRMQNQGKPASGSTPFNYGSNTQNQYGGQVPWQSGTTGKF